MLFNPGFYISCDKSFRSGEGTYHRDLFPVFRGTEEHQRALPAPAASQVILVKIINIPLWNILGQPALCPNSTKREGLISSASLKMR